VTTAAGVCPGDGSAAAMQRRLLMRAAADDSPPPLQAVPIVDMPAPRGRVAAGLAAWAVLVLWALFLAPGEPGGSDFLTELLTHPIAPDVPTFAWAEFSAAGVMSGCFAALLAAGSGRAQRPLPAVPFVVGSAALGGLMLGPYLALRRARPAVEVVGGREGEEEAPADASEAGQAVTLGGDVPAPANDDAADADGDGPLPFGHSALLRIGESKLFAAGLVAVAAWCYVTAFVPLDAPFEAWDLILYARGVDWIVAATSDRTVAATTADLAYMSVAVWGPLTEDMRRRRLYDGGWADVLFAASVMAVPVFGVALYALLRPPLPRRGEDAGAGADA
ncbi:hypothetical protein MMPV_003710, partial [Pyropia vietnamensis]